MPLTRTPIAKPTTSHVRAAMPTKASTPGSVEPNTGAPALPSARKAGMASSGSANAINAHTASNPAAAPR